MATLWNTIEHRYIKHGLRVLWPWRTFRQGDITIHYKRVLDGGGTNFGQMFIPFLRSAGMPKQQRIYEWCSGPGFIGFSLLANGMCETLCLADVNPAAVECCRRTVRENRLEDRVSVYLSDNLRSIPASEKWDLVVSNPPHFFDAPAGNLILHDPDWRIHREFFSTVQNHLKPGGVIVLQENNQGSTVATFRAMIEQAGLEIVFSHGEFAELTKDNVFYFIGIMRKGEPPPDWVVAARRPQ